MKIRLELFGASRDFSDKDFLEIEIQNKSSIHDLRNEIIDYLNKNFAGNKSFIKVVKSSAFCSENNEIISDNYKITKDQKIGIIPPIGGG
jgi:sulfur-carrier protein|tara:strand:+ start:1258 stop:1527 length:270 start_codon:yes stop_codon:yes gene_type:complete